MYFAEFLLVFFLIFLFGFGVCLIGGWCFLCFEFGNGTEFVIGFVFRATLICCSRRVCFERSVSE